MCTSQTFHVVVSTIWKIQLKLVGGCIPIPLDPPLSVIIRSTL